MTAPTPGSPEWMRIITSSKVPVILGVSPYDSPYSLWHQMKGLTAKDEQSKVMARGHFLEEGILQWWLSEHPDYELHHRQEFVSTMDWAGATCDAVVFHKETGELSVVEVKTSTQTDEYGEQGTDAIPQHVLCQVYWQMAMARAVQRVHIALLSTFLDFKEFVVERDEAIQSALIAKCKEFYDSLESDTPPPLDDSLATFECLKAQHPDIDKGAIAEIDAELADEYRMAVESAKEWDSRLTLAKSKVLAAAGNANYIECNGLRIARRQPNRNGVSLVSVL